MSKWILYCCAISRQNGDLNIQACILHKRNIFWPLMISKKKLHVYYSIVSITSCTIWTLLLQRNDPKIFTIYLLLMLPRFFWLQYFSFRVCVYLLTNINIKASMVSMSFMWHKLVGCHECHCSSIHHHFAEITVFACIVWWADIHGEYACNQIQR